MDSISPWVVALFYITAGYLLVAGTTAASVAFVARTRDNRLLYGALALLALAGAGFQLASVFYHQASTLAGAVNALAWQVDCASLASVALLAVFAYEGARAQTGRALLSALVLILVVLVVNNRASGFSARFSEVEALTTFAPGLFHPLHFVSGHPGLAAFFWYGAMAALWLCCGLLYLRMWRHLDRTRALVLALVVLGSGFALVQGFAIDIGHWRGVYLQGFVLSLFVLIVSVGLTIEAAKRSQRLSMRERQMQGEVLQRRRAEDKMQRLSQVFMQAPMPIHIVDLNGRALQVNEESIRYIKRDISTSPGVDFLEVLEQLGKPRHEVLKALAKGEALELGPYFFAAGQPVDALYLVHDAWLQFGLYPIFNAERQLEEFVLRLQDVSANRFAENAIKTISMAVSAETGHAFFKQIVVYLARLLKKKHVYIGLRGIEDGVPVIRTLAAADDGELEANFAFPLRGTPAEKVLELGAFAVARQLQRDFLGQPLLQESNAQSYLGAAIRDENKVPIGLLAVMDIKPMDHIEQLQEIVNIFVARAGTELQRLESEKTIRTLAYADHLTGLANRIQLHDYLVDLLEGPSAQVPSAFILIDLDHFKTINDALGHDVGDDVLRCLGRRLQKAVESNMVAARIGGDEFAVVVHGLGTNAEADLAAIAVPIMRMMERPVHVGEHLLDVGCTMGVVLFPEFAENAVDVFRCADIALYQAKSSGRGGYQLFTPAMRESVSTRLKIEKGLRSALQNQEFRVFYQPQVDQHGQVVGAEALVRWFHPEQGMIPPDQFIPVAEESGLINAIGQWVLQQALSALRAWTDAEIPFQGHLSINVSPWQFARPDFVETTLAIIEKAKVSPSYVTLEITESAVLSDIKETIGKLTALRSIGVTIALDDFGTGYSSLAYLRDLPLDRLKIDKSFVDALETMPREPLVESMIAIGNNMGLEVVAEGVETTVQLERLQDLGCTLYQGYLFSKPLPESDLLAWLKRQHSAVAERLN